MKDLKFLPKSSHLKVDIEQWPRKMGKNASSFRELPKSTQGSAALPLFKASLLIKHALYLVSLLIRVVSIPTMGPPLSIYHHHPLKKHISSADSPFPILSPETQSMSNFKINSTCSNLTIYKSNAQMTLEVISIFRYIT